MARLFYSYRDGEVYILHKSCPLELLMDEQAGGNGLMIYASKEVFEIVEYMDKAVNEFFEHVSTVTGKKC